MRVEVLFISRERVSLYLTVIVCEDGSGSAYSTAVAEGDGVWQGLCCGAGGIPHYGRIVFMYDIAAMNIPS